MSRFNMRGAQAARFLRAVEAGYRDNPYHNRTHAADVLQTMHALLTRGGLVPHYADPLTQLACYLAAATHDLEHVGLTNDFLIASNHELAIVYNDKSPVRGGGGSCVDVLGGLESCPGLCVCSAAWVACPACQHCVAHCVVVAAASL